MPSSGQDWPKNSSEHAHNAFLAHTRQVIYSSQATTHSTPSLNHCRAGKQMSYEALPAGSRPGACRGHFSLGFKTQRGAPPCGVKTKVHLDAFKAQEPAQPL